MTLYVFDMNIPAANDNPSVDQPPMLQNNMSTEGILSTDHITFNIDNGGQHKQVTFNQDPAQGFPYVPSLPATPPVLFTNIVSGLSQLFYYSGDAAHSSTQYASANPGSTFAFGGIILKWGAVAGTSNNSAITFVSPFPNNVFSLVVSGGIPSGTQPTINFNQASLSTTGFVAKIAGTQPINLYYIAIGN